MSRELTDEHIDSIRQCFVRMNEYAKTKETNYFGVNRPPEEVLQDVYFVLANTWHQTLKDNPE